MMRLQSACSDIPGLTTATKDLHDRITALVIDANASMQRGQLQSQQQQQQGRVTFGSSTMPLQGGVPHSRPGTMVS